MATAARHALRQRPRPPANLVATGAPVAFAPAPDLLEWIRGAYLEESGPLHDPQHAPLLDASIGVLWTNAENSRHGRRIAGEAELVSRMRHQGRWLRARSECQLEGWFGTVPDFVITLDALHADSADDVVFCALVDHELCHCAQETDEFGMPKFNRVTGEPKWTIKGHDVEEFVSVVRRFGVEACGDAAVDFVIAAAGKPEIARARVANACGTCLRIAA